MPFGAAFSATQCARRVTRVRTAMAARGIDVLIATDPSNQTWLTKYDGWSVHVHQAMVLPMDGQPVWWGRGQDAHGGTRRLSGHFAR